MTTDAEVAAVELPFVCRHADPRCKDDPCPWGIARFLCNARADSSARAAAHLLAQAGAGERGGA